MTEPRLPYGNGVNKTRPPGLSPPCPCCGSATNHCSWCWSPEAEDVVDYGYRRLTRPLFLDGGEPVEHGWAVVGMVIVGMIGFGLGALATKLWWVCQ